MADAREAGGADHPAERLRFWKFADRLDEVAIGLAIAGHRLTELGYDLEREQLIEPVEAGHVDAGEFQAEESAAGPQHAMRLAQRQIDTRHVANAERDRAGIEVPVGQRQRLGVALDEGHLLLEVPGNGARV